MVMMEWSVMGVDEGSEDGEEQIGEEEEEARITLLYLWSPRWKESIFTSQRPARPRSVRHLIPLWEHVHLTPVVSDDL